MKKETTLDRFIKLKKNIKDIIKICGDELETILKEKHRYQAFEITKGEVSDLLTQLEIDIINGKYKNEE